LSNAIKRAAELLRQQATCLRESHTVPPEHENWTDDLAAKAEYDELLSVVAELERMSGTVAVSVDTLKRWKEAISPYWFHGDGEESYNNDDVIALDGEITALIDKAKP
jgi:hypothetical protein